MVYWTDWQWFSNGLKWPALIDEDDTLTMCSTQQVARDDNNNIERGGNPPLFYKMADKTSLWWPWKPAIDSSACINNGEIMVVDIGKLCVFKDTFHGNYKTTGSKIAPECLWKTPSPTWVAHKDPGTGVHSPQERRGLTTHPSKKHRCFEASAMVVSKHFCSRKKTLQHVHRFELLVVFLNVHCWGICFLCPFPQQHRLQLVSNIVWTRSALRAAQVSGLRLMFQNDVLYLCISCQWCKSSCKSRCHHHLATGESRGC